MSRDIFNSDLHPYTHHVTGNDHAIGKFIDITDDRYANSPDDEQGEGYVFEWSQLFGIGTNLIGATLEDVRDLEKLQEKVDIFIAALKPFKFKYRLVSTMDDSDAMYVSEQDFDDYNSAGKAGEDAKYNIPSGFKDNYYVQVYSYYITN